MSALNFIYTKVNHMKSVVKILTLAVGYVLYIPFICFYSYILGPILKAVLIPGGLVLIALMMSPKAAWQEWNSARQPQNSPSQSRSDAAHRESANNKPRKNQEVSQSFNFHSSDAGAGVGCSAYNGDKLL